MATSISFFFKITDDGEPFHVQWYVGENDITCGHDKISHSDTLLQDIRLL